MSATTLPEGLADKTRLSDSQGGWTAGEKIFTFAALLLVAVLAIGSFRSQSMTIDEIVDIPSGLSYWQKQDTRLNVEHPPLLKMISAVPLLFTHLNVDYNDPSWCGGGSAECEWTFGHKLLEDWNTNIQHWVILTRFPMLVLTLLLGFVIYSMARSLAGPWGGALSLALFATSPFYLGLGPLVLTDMGLPLMVLMATWTFASLWSDPSRRNIGWFALALAGGLVSKFSALALIPTFVLMALYWRFFSQDSPGRALRQAADVRGSTPRLSGFVCEWYTGLGIAFAGALIYLFYLITCWNSDSVYIFAERAQTFGTWNTAGKITAHVSQFLNRHLLLAKLTNPVWLYLSGVLDVYYRQDRTTYVLGKWYPHGVWFYFPVVSFFKLAPGMIACFALLVVLLALYAIKPWAARPLLVPERYRLHAVAMAGTLVVFTLSAMASKLNIGIRHFSVPITILVLLSALIVPLMRSILPVGFARSIGALLVGGLAVSSLITAVTVYPRYIAYYNWFRLGTPKQEIAVNSNLYWGQSLIDLESFRKDHHITKIYVDSRTFRPSPDAYVSGAVEWECDNAEPAAPEWAAVNANFLLRDAPTCAGLMRYPHWSLPDESIVVFHITDSSYAEDQREYRRAHPKMAWTVLGW